ncbi:MAG: chemotaxis protein CheW [Rubrivivax sp.]
MARREALRELQSRLAERLQQARAEARGAAWLAVECAEQGLLLPLAGAGEIFAVGTVLPVPHTQPWFAGVTSLRGNLHGVVDLAAFLGLRAPQPAGSVREQARLLALNPACGAHCALLVDRLAGLRAADQMQPEPDDGAAKPGFAGAAWHDDGGRRWQEIDLAALACHEQFLGIGA